MLAEAADRSDLPCRSPMNWRAARSGWQNSPRPEPRSRRRPRNASTVSGPSIGSGLRRATPRLRQLAGSPGASRRRSRAPCPDQSDRRAIAHHAGGRRWLRAVLQRPGGRGQPAGGRGRRLPGSQRQAAARADVGQARRPARGSGPARDPAGRHRLLQRGQCRGLPDGGDRAADRPGPRHPSLGERFAEAPPAIQRRSRPIA